MVLSPDDRQVRRKEHYRRLAPVYGSRSNRTCEESYVQLVRRFLGPCNRVLEVGCGSSDLLDRLRSPLRVGCDLSEEMLGQRPKQSQTHCLVAAGENLPFRDSQFDGMFLVNVLEHVVDLDATLQESARVLAPGGIWLAVTPNGNWEFWLDLAERWSLKLPEGPHSFLTPRRLRLAARRRFALLEHRTCLVLPVGPPALVGLIDRLTCSAALGWGFFQYIVGRKPVISDHGQADSPGTLALTSRECRAADGAGASS